MTASGALAGQRRLAQLERGGIRPQPEDDIRPGDVVAVHRPGIDQPTRMGEVLEVLGVPGHRRYHIRWDEKHESIFYPAEGVAVHRVEVDGTGG